MENTTHEELEPIEITDPTNVPSGLMTLTTAATAFYFGAKKAI